MAKKTKGQELQEQLTWAFPHIGKDKPEQAEKAFKYCAGCGKDRAGVCEGSCKDA